MTAPPMHLGMVFGREEVHEVVFQPWEGLEFTRVGFADVESEGMGSD